MWMTEVNRILWMVIVLGSIWSGLEGGARGGQDKTRGGIDPWGNPTADCRGGIDPWGGCVGEPGEIE